MAGRFTNFVKRRMGRPPNEPPRDTTPWPNLFQVGRTNNMTGLVFKSTPRNLRYFSRTPYARRAINTIKNPIKMLDWEICPLDGIEMNSELERQIAVATNCFSRPNSNDDFQSLLEQLLEDYLIGAGAIETQLGGDESHPLFMWPVDGLSIQIHPDWNGKPDSAHYAQTTGYGTEFGGGQILNLTDQELLYLRPNPNTATPFGFGPLEIAFSSISRLLSVGEFAGNVAGNAKPNFGLDLQGLPPEQLNAMKSWWRNEIEGQGQVPFFASAMGADGRGSGGVKVLRFYPEGDDALYLKYQEMLIRELGVAFDLSPQNFGIERDVNRNTSEVSEDRDWDAAIKPAAHDVAKSFTRHCIQGRLGFSQLRFRFKSLDREDELVTWQIYEKRYKNNAITPNEMRRRMGEQDMDSPWADKTFADMEVAMNAARSASQVLDPALTDGMVLPAPKPPAAPSKSKK